MTRLVQSQFRDLQRTNAQDTQYLPSEAIQFESWVNQKDWQWLEDAGIGYQTLGVVGREPIGYKTFDIDVDGLDGVLRVAETLPLREIKVDYRIKAPNAENFVRYYQKLKIALLEKEFKYHFKDDPDWWYQGTVTDTDLPERGRLDAVASFTISNSDPYKYHSTQTTDLKSKFTADLPTIPTEIRVTALEDGAGIFIQNKDLTISLTDASFKKNDVIKIRPNDQMVTYSGVNYSKWLDYDTDLENFYVLPGDQLIAYGGNKIKFTTTTKTITAENYEFVLDDYNDYNGWILLFFNEFTPENTSFSGVTATQQNIFSSSGVDWDKFNDEWTKGGKHVDSKQDLNKIKMSKITVNLNAQPEIQVGYSLPDFDNDYNDALGGLDFLISGSTSGDDIKYFTQVKKEFQAWARDSTIIRNNNRAMTDAWQKQDRDIQSLKAKYGINSSINAYNQYLAGNEVTYRPNEDDYDALDRQYDNQEFQLQQQIDNYGDSANNDNGKAALQSQLKQIKQDHKNTLANYKSQVETAKKNASKMNENFKAFKEAADKARETYVKVINNLPLATFQFPKRYVKQQITETKETIVGQSKIKVEIDYNGRA